MRFIIVGLLTLLTSSGLARGDSSILGKWVPGSRLDPCGQYANGKVFCFEITKNFLESKDPETFQKARQVEEATAELPMYATHEECIKSIPVLPVADHVLWCQSQPAPGFSFDYLQNDCVELSNCGCEPGHRLDEHPDRVFVKIFRDLDKCLSVHPEGSGRTARWIEKVRKKLF